LRNVNRKEFKIYIIEEFTPDFLLLFGKFLPVAMQKIWKTLWKSRYLAYIALLYPGLKPGAIKITPLRGLKTLLKF